MDQAVIDFRTTAAQENHGRRGLKRRYSAVLQQQAVEYWRRRHRTGEGVRSVAAALGVAPWSLRRWIRAGQTRPAFHSVQVISSEPAREVSRVVIRLAADGLRVEGLDIEAAAKLLGLLR